MKSRFTVIEFPVFCHFTVHVEITSSFKDTMKKYKHTKDICHQCDLGADAMTISVDNEPISYIFLKPNVSVGTIAHECWHAIKNLVNYVNVGIENETVAYHLGYLVDKVFKFVHNRK